MRYKAITFTSKPFAKKKVFEKCRPFLFEDFIRRASADEIRALFAAEEDFLSGSSPCGEEAGQDPYTRANPEILEKYREYPDEIIDNRLAGEALNGDGFYDPTVPADEGTSLNEYKNEEHRRKIFFVCGTFALIAVSLMIIVIYIFSKFSTFY